MHACTNQLVVGVGTCENPAMDFLAIDSNLGRRRNADPDFVAVVVIDGDRDAAIDDDRFASLARQHEHENSSVRDDGHFLVGKKQLACQQKVRSREENMGKWGNPGSREWPFDSSDAQRVAHKSARKQM